MKNKIILSIDVEKDYLSKKTSYKGIEELKSLIKFFNKNNIHITLFVTGKVMEKFPEYFSKISNQHEIASHGYDHNNFNKLSPEQKYKDIKKSTDTIKGITGKKPIGFRSPRLKTNKNILDYLEQLGYRYDSSNSILQRKIKTNKNIIELRPTPNFLLKLPFGEKIITTLPYNKEEPLPYKVLFIHPWELLEPDLDYIFNNKREIVKFYNYIGNGEGFKNRLISFIQEYEDRVDFISCKEYLELLCDKKCLN